MPKRRDTGRPTPSRPEEPAGSPAQDEVERAIRNVVERLRPKPPKPSGPAKKPYRKAGPSGRLSLVWDRDGEGA